MSDDPPENCDDCISDQLNVAVELQNVLDALVSYSNLLSALKGASKVQIGVKDQASYALISAAPVELTNDLHDVLHDLITKEILRMSAYLSGLRTIQANLAEGK